MTTGVESRLVQLRPVESPPGSRFGFDTLNGVLHGRVGASSVMVGRSSALARLVDVLDTIGLVDGDQPAIALVAGEPGIGKTRLVREFIAALPATCPTFVVAGEPGSMGRSFGALGPFAESTDPSHALIDEVADAAQRGPVVVAVEDIHWLDAESAGVIDSLTKQPWPNLMLVGTYRSGELSRGAPGGELVQRLERRHTVEQIRLDRLDRAEVAAMVAGIIQRQPSSAVVAAVDRRSGGVPFVIEELVRFCRADTFADDVLTAELPWSLDEVVRQQINGLATDERLAIETLAIYGRAIAFDTLCVVAQFDEARALLALRSLIERAVLVESSDDRFWFVHALVADAVSGQLIGRERRRLHERCFEAERVSSSSDPWTLARHAAGAGRFEEIVGIAREGAPKYLARGASFQALRLAADGLTEAPDDPLLLGLATEAAWRLDFNGEALVTANRWCQVATDPVDRIEAERLHGRLHQEEGEDTGVRTSIARLKTWFGEFADERHRARAAAAVAQLLMLAGDSTDAVEWGDRAIHHGRVAGDQHAVTRGMVERGSALLGVGHRSESITALTDAAEAARSIGDAVLESRAINNSLEAIPVFSARGRHQLSSLIEVTSRSGLDKLGVGPANFWHMQLAIGEGNMPGVRRALGDRTKNTDDSRTWSNHRSSATEALLALEEGRYNDASAWATANPEPDSSCEKEPVMGLSIAVAAAVGNHDRARALFETLLSFDPMSDIAILFTELLFIVEAALDTGIAPDTIRQRLLHGWLAGHPSHAELVDPIEGLLSIAEGRDHEAVAHLSAALTEPDERLIRPLLGSLRTSLGQALLATGDRAGALAAVTHVIEHDLARWPGVRRDRAEALARRLRGASPRSDGDLTVREREVAALLAEGLTNGQLAERLFISPKTAAAHVSNILAKLGLASRAEIAAWAVRNGLKLSVA
jgi:DNA-binding CsgD family transcriptional regulator